MTATELEMHVGRDSFWGRFKAGFDGTASGIATKAAVSEPMSALAPPAIYGTQLQVADVSPYQAWLLYLNVSSFARVVDLIADAVSALTPVVQENGKLLDGHPITAFLARPGFNRTRKRLVKELVVQYLVTGTAYSHIYGNPDAPPTAIDVLKTFQVNPVPGSDMWPQSYQFNEGLRSIRFERDQNPRDFRWIDMSTELSEIIPIYDMDGSKRGIGLPRLNAIRNDVELRLKGIQHNASVLDKGARLSGLLAVAEFSTPEQEESLKNQFQARATGVHNAGSVMVTSGKGLAFTPFSQSMKDMDFAKLIQIVEDAIVSRYNVPVTLYRTDAQTNNNYETAWNILYDQAVLPTFQIIYSGLAQMFTERLGASIEIIHDSLTSPILARAATARARELFAANLVSRNEARQIAGYEPVLGGDIIYGPMGMVPQGEDLFTGIDDADAEPGERKPVVVHPQKPGTEEAEDDDKPAKKPKPARNSEDDDKSFRVLENFAAELGSRNLRVVR